MMYSDAYLDTLQAGPFPGRIDPWSEDPYCFHQVHSGMIDDLVNQMARPIGRLGYYIGTESSLQIMQGESLTCSFSRRPANPLKRGTMARQPQRSPPNRASRVTLTCPNSGRSRSSTPKPLNWSRSSRSFHRAIKQRPPSTSAIAGGAARGGKVKRFTARAARYPA
jgi:hypothetical protein